MRSLIDRLDWDDLRIFIEAVKQQSISGAAKQLAISHSTVSRRLARLEHVLGVPLFERQRDGLLLTGQGQAILRRVDEIEGGVHRLRSEVMGMEDVGGTIRLATMEGIASLFIAPELGGFCRDNAGIHVELITSPTTVHVAKREADLFLSFFRPYGSGMISQKIGRFSAGLFAAPSYLDRHGTPKNISALRDHHFVGYVDQYVRLDAVRWLEELVENPDLVFTSNSMIAQMGAALGGMGIIALPFFCEPEARGLVPVVSHHRVQRTCWLTVHEDMRNLPRIQLFKRFLSSLFREREDHLNRPAGPAVHAR